MNVRKGICLILCILLLTALAPLPAFAAPGESADGVWASIALTGGANKLLFSSDRDVEELILEPDESTPEQYILPEGVSYDAESNTLSLTDFDAPTANLVLTMMGGDFKIRLSGSSKLASVVSESKGRGGSICFCGDGSLEIASSETAILIRADGAPDFVRVEPQVRLTAASGSGSAIRVEDSSLTSGVIRFDTSVPELRESDTSTTLTGRQTSDGAQIDVCTLPGEEGLFGIEAVPVLDAEGERLAYNVYSLSGQDEEGRYAAVLLEEDVGDISAYELVRTPHVWILTDAYSGAPVSRVRFARFTLSASASEGGALILSQNAVGRGGSVTVSAVPEDGYKLVSLSVNGAEVSAVNGSYTIAGISSDQSVEALFAAASATEICVCAPENTQFEVPADGAEDFVSEPFTALVKDGAGDAVGATVLWSVEPQIEGVSLGADGRVTVSSAAKHAVGERQSFSVTAAVYGTELSDSSAGFTVSLAERRAYALHLTRSGEALAESDTVLIPTAGETSTQRYGAVLFDQYGSAREEEILWSAPACPSGVRREGDTLTVSDSCADGSTLTLTAAAASDSAVSASVTLSFVRQQTEEPTTRGAVPTREEPSVSWPSVTLAADPSYGITWAELVTLGEDGEATLGGETIEGSFSLNRTGTDLPALSDSFKIVFSYGEGDDAQSVESDERSVTIARRELDASMVTLSPSSMSYTGAACEPAVSVRIGTRALIPETDFHVTGYADNIEISTDSSQASVSLEGLGNYTGTVTKSFSVTPIPGSAVTCTITPCQPEDAATRPSVVLRYGEATLEEGTDYDLGLQYDIPTKTGTATISFKGHYSGTRILAFDLPNYLITEGANSIWSKSTSAALPFKANGALVKFTELTVDGKTVPVSYYSTASGSTVVTIKPDYLKTLTAGKHIVGVAYQDGKALAIFTVTEVERRGVATGDSRDLTSWIIVLAVGLAALCVIGWGYVRAGRKKKRKKTGRHG